MYVNYGAQEKDNYDMVNILGYSDGPEFECGAPHSRGRRLTYREIENILQSAVTNNMYRNVTITRLREEPEEWKHACITSGVNILEPEIYFLSDREVVLFYYCESCGVLVYYFDKEQY